MRLSHSLQRLLLLFVFVGSTFIIGCSQGPAPAPAGTEVGKQIAAETKKARQEAQAERKAARGRPNMKGRGPG
jgi:hypothetical protein